MNIKRLSVFGFALSFVGMFFALSVQAQTKPIVTVQTNTIASLDITFTPSRRGLVKGSVTGMYTEDNVKEVQFRIKNYPDGDEIWKEAIRWQEDFRTEQQVLIPFEFDISKIAITEKLIFTTEFLKEEGDLIASGTRGAQVPPKFADIRTESVSDLVITEDGNINVSFLFVNGSKEQKVKPELVIKEHTEDGVVVFSLLEEAEVSLLPMKEHLFEFSFPRPESPERYVVEVSVFDSRGNQVTGYLRDSFLIEGDFAEIKSVQIRPDRSVEAGENVEFVVSGVVDNEKGPLEMNVSAIIMPEQEGILPLTETRSFTAEGDRFQEVFAFVVPVATKEFDVTVRISRDGNLIEEKSSAYSAQRETARSLLDVPMDIVNKYSGGGFEVWMVLVLTLAVIVLLVSLLHRRKKMMIWFLLVAPFLGMGVADAAWQVDWEYPETGVIFNSQSGEGFEEVVFRGMVYDNATWDGYFQGGLDSVTVDFTKGGDLISVAVDVNDVTINADKMTYGFQVDLSDAGTFSEGDWEAQVTFDDSGQPEMVQTNWGGTIEVDETMPTIAFSYAPETFTDSVIATSISCVDGGAGCLDESVYPYYAEFAPFAFSVLGNFSTGFENGIRGFEVCDKVMNCTSKDVEKLSIDFYDPVDPELTTGMTVERDGLSALTGEGGFVVNQMAADNVLALSLLGASDPTEVAVYTQDDDACGRGITDDTYLAEDVQVSFSVVSGAGFPGVKIWRERDGGTFRGFSFVSSTGIGSYSDLGTLVGESSYQFYLEMITGESTTEISSIIAMDGTWSGTLGAGTEYETQFSNFTATVVSDSQRCTPKYFVCAVNQPAGGGGPQRVEMTEFEDANQTCADKKGANWASLPTSECGFTFTFPFILENCSGGGGGSGFPFTFPFGVE